MITCNIKGMISWQYLEIMQKEKTVIFYLKVIYFDSFTLKSLLFIFPFKCLPYRDSGGHMYFKNFTKATKFFIFFHCIFRGISTLERESRTTI